MKIHKKLFYTGTVILTCLLTACQETPKEDIVKNKAESNLEDEVQQSTQADTEEDSWIKTIFPCLEFKKFFRKFKKY